MNIKKPKTSFSSQKGAIQLPILIGLLILAVALPAATRLVQQRQETREKAAYEEGTGGGGQDIAPCHLSRQSCLDVCNVGCASVGDCWYCPSQGLVPTRAPTPTTGKDEYFCPGGYGSKASCEIALKCECKLWDTTTFPDGDIGECWKCKSDGNGGNCIPDGQCDTDELSCCSGMAVPDESCTSSGYRCRPIDWVIPTSPPQACAWCTNPDYCRSKGGAPYEDYGYCGIEGDQCCDVSGGDDGGDGSGSTSEGVWFNLTVWDGIRRWSTESFGNTDKRHDWIATSYDCDEKEGVSFKASRNINVNIIDDEAGGHFDIKVFKNREFTLSLVLPKECGWQCDNWDVIERSENLSESSVVKHGAGCDVVFTPNTSDWRTGIAYNIKKTTSPTSTPVPPECVNNEDCDDDNLCTTDVCNDDGSCEYTPINCNEHAECNQSTGNCQCSSDNWGDCDNSWDNGCETSLTDKANCGACGNQCGSDEICREKECVKVGEYPTCLINQMAEDLGIDISYILLIENTNEQWPDSCLGCPESDESCLTVITAGKKLVLQSVYPDSMPDSNQCWQYEYHTAGAADDLAVHCDNYRLCQEQGIDCPQCPTNGDFNGDGKVDEFDYGIFFAHFEDEGIPGEVEGDANCDGVVDEFDYGIFFAHFGEGE